MKSLALFCDYGLDDAAATLYLLKNANKFKNIYILPVAGNVPLKTSHINALRLLTYVEEVPENVHIIDTSSVPQNEEYLPSIHGKDGIGDILPLEFDKTIEATPYDEWLKNVDDSFILASVGPCTVPLDVLSKKGQLELLIMGGNVNEKPNYKGYEFNHGMDVDAFAKCVKHPHFVGTLDTCHHPLCDFNLYESESNSLFDKVVKRGVQMSNERGEKGSFIYDLITVIFLIHPEKFIAEKLTDKDANELTVLKYIGEKFILA